MLMIPGSCLFAFNLPVSVKHYLFTMLFLVLVIYKKRYRRSVYAILIVGLLAIFTVFTHLLNGGAGIASLLQFAVCLLSAHIAISYNKDSFLDRYIRLIYYMSIISLAFWITFLIIPQLIDLWPGKSYLTQTVGTMGWERYYHGKGLFLYSYLEMHPTRNCGVYTEPGVHQIVLNSALYILLFWKDKLQFRSEKIYRRSIFVILATIVSCQSTTGYISLLIIVLLFYINRQTQFSTKKIKEYIGMLFVLAVIILLIDYAMGGNQSIIYLQVIQKLFGGTTHGFDVSAGTGQYRVGTILVSLSTVINHPLGVGHDVFDAYKNSFGSGLVAASFVSFAAVYGIIAWLTIIVAIFYPVFKTQRRLIAIAFLLIFINTTLAQTELFYPTLMIVPIYSMTKKNIMLSRGNLNDVSNKRKNQKK